MWGCEMDILVDCKCKICGEVFKVKPYEADRRKMCGKESCYREDKRLTMRAYRQTENGRAMVKHHNLRYKRPDVDKTCGICGQLFKTARENRYICSKEECQDKGKYLRQKKYRINNIEKARSRDITNKAINRHFLNGHIIKREPCLVCGEIKTEAHHHNYSKPREVIHLCKPHHMELHSWDSN